MSGIKIKHNLDEIEAIKLKFSKLKELGNNFSPVMSDIATLLENSTLERLNKTSIAPDGTVYVGIKGTFSELITKGEFSNSPHIVMQECYQSPDMPEVRAAALASVGAYQYQIDPARQLRTLKLNGCLPPKTGLTKDERNLLLNSGVATTTNNQGDVLIERTVTNYRLNKAGFSDVSYMDLETLKTLGYLRYSYIQRFLQKFPRHKLAGNDYPVSPGQAIMTPKVGMAESIALANDWYNAGLIENIEGFKQSISSQRDNKDTERLNQLLQPDVINNLRVIAAKIQFIL